MTRTITVQKVEITISTVSLKVTTVPLTPAILKQLDYSAAAENSFFDGVELIGRFAGGVWSADHSSHDLVLCRSKRGDPPFPNYLVWNPHSRIDFERVREILAALPKLIITR